MKSHTSLAVEAFKGLAADPRFKGWPVVGQPVYGEKIPYFGQPMNYTLLTGNGEESYTSIVRHFGWVVVFAVIEHAGQPHVITLVQWKPGVNCASWELPPGGIGQVGPEATEEDILHKTQATFLKETGYGDGNFLYLGRTIVETGKYRGAGPNDHGLPAHMYLATDLKQLQGARSPAKNEIMETLLVPLVEFPEVLASGHFIETSAVVCAYKALVALGHLNWR